MSGSGLEGLRILVPESRALDLFAGMLEAAGATTLRCPLVTILDAGDPAPIEAWLGRLVEGAFDDLILLTGEGLRRLVAAAERTGKKPEAVAAVAQLRTILRGPKPAKALREIGLTPGVSAVRPTTDGVIETLSTLDLAGHTVGVQLYPGNPNAPLLDALARVGARSDPVLPYRYASDAETDLVAAAIRGMAAGKIDFIALTSSPQLGRLREVATERGLEAEMREGLARTRIAAVGPVVAEAVRAMGFEVAAEPETSFHMKPLVNAIRAAVGRG
jgi:uroporphyrinogen-III synthase